MTDSTDKTLVLTVGLPRSGKSTWARAQGCPVVCPDEIRLALHGQRFAPQAEPFVWAIARVMVTALFASGATRVVLDATGVTRARRDEWRSSSWRTKLKVFPLDADVCRARAVATHPDLLPVIDRMLAEYQPPGDGEELWEEPSFFRNYYRCYACQCEWVSEDDGCPDDDCGACGARHCTPYKSTRTVER